MSTNIADGGPAFPHLHYVDGVGPHYHHGISTRDYFAAKALEGWLATYGEHPHPALNPEYAATVASLSYRMADAMLAARSKQ